MTRDRHSDRLHERLLAGHALTDAEQRHVARCTECQGAVARVERLDELLRAAAVPLAREPIPDLADAPASARRGSPWLMVAPITAAAALALAVGVGLTQVTDWLSGPTGPEPSAAASPDSKLPATPDAVAPVIQGAQPCSDWTTGFSLWVPEGWFASVRDGDLIACAFLAPQRFDPRSVDVDPPIRLSVEGHSDPRGAILADGTEIPVGQDGHEAGRRWEVERNGADWLVYVVALTTVGEDPPQFLHLATRLGDRRAVDALDEVVASLVIGEPEQHPLTAQAAASTLFTDADVCTDPSRGLSVIFPEAWWTNTPVGRTQGCSFFAPRSFDVPEDGSLPDGVAIDFQLVSSGAFAWTNERQLGNENLIVDRFLAERWEYAPGGPPDVSPDQFFYRYAIHLDGDRPMGPTLVVTLRSELSDDYSRDKLVLDEMMRRLVVSPTPTRARARLLEPIGFCGSELIVRTEHGERFDSDARRCLWEAWESGESAEMISVRPAGTSGGATRTFYRVHGRDLVDVIIDGTRDPTGSGMWELLRCRSLQRVGDEPVSGAILLEPVGCEQELIPAP